MKHSGKSSKETNTKGKIEGYIQQELENSNKKSINCIENSNPSFNKASQIKVIGYNTVNRRRRLQKKLGTDKAKVPAKTILQNILGIDASSFYKENARIKKRCKLS